MMRHVTHLDGAGELCVVLMGQYRTVCFVAARSALLRHGLLSLLWHGLFRFGTVCSLCCGTVS